MGNIAGFFFVASPCAISTEEFSGGMAFSRISKIASAPKKRSAKVKPASARLVDHVADAIFVYDFEQGTIVDLNPQACEGLGYTRQELVGKTALAFHPDPDLPTLERSRSGPRPGRRSSTHTGIDERMEQSSLSKYIPASFGTAAAASC